MIESKKAVLGEIFRAVFQPGGASRELMFRRAVMDGLSVGMVAVSPAFKDKPGSALVLCALGIGVFVLNRTIGAPVDKWGDP